MKTPLLIFLFFFGLATGLSQSLTIETSVYFDTDKYALRTDAIIELNELNDSIKDLPIDSIRISGNTDNRASNSYNVILSRDRSTKVQEYLHSIGTEKSLIQIVFFGEEKPKASNNSDNGKQENRRVDITVYYNLPEVVILDTLPKNLCKEDTIIRLKNGTEFVFNKCEYLEKKDCIELTEFTNVNDAMANDMTTVDENGDPLASGGMIGFTPILSEGCQNLCFDNRITIRILIDNDPLCLACGRGARLYDTDENGNWIQTNEELGIVEIDNKRYYEFVLPTCWVGFKNIDCKIPYNKVKFKAPLGYEFINVNVSSDCPFSIYNFKPGDEMRDRILKKRKMPCFMGNGDVRAYVKNKDGDTLMLSQRPLEDLDKYIWFARCKTKKEEIERKIFGLFPYKKRWLYRKYKIKKKDLIPAE